MDADADTKADRQRHLERQISNIREQGGGAEIDKRNRSTRESEAHTLAK
jgi:hypothetical protein